MGIRKNAKFLTATERENFVKACVMMKADIVNPAAPAASQYSRWDELVAIHLMIQNANAPGSPGVNFGHGGSGSFSFSPAIPMPDFSALGIKRNVDTLDFRAAYNYTYDTIAIIGIGLDQTGSMFGLTPDPMVTASPDVTKWEAAKRGVSAFLQDCETVQDSGTIYVMAGIKTFRTLAGNQFTPVFSSPNMGLIKAGTPFSKASFEANIASQTPGGLTPLADALQDVQNTMVQAPFGGLPADEQRYLAMLTDGMLTTGSAMSSIPNGSFSRTAVFGMGFGTPADVDYATIASMVAKGKTLTTQQVFHGENAGTIDKFYSNALSAAIGFTTIFDPVIELFAGEHTHLDYYATSAEDTFMITAQGMDFDDNNWDFHLHGPNHQLVYGNMQGHDHAGGCNHCCPGPHVTARRGHGRLSLVVQRNSASKECWVGKWTLMVSYKAKNFVAMFMPSIVQWLFPVAAGPVRGPRYSRLLTHPKERKATRNIFRKALNRFDVSAVSTNTSNNEACTILVNIYARTNLRIELTTPLLNDPGKDLNITVSNLTSIGSTTGIRSTARLVAPAMDISKLIPEDALKRISALESQKKFSSKLDTALILAQLEKSNKREMVFVRDEEIKVVQHGDSPLHIHEKNTKIPGIYHAGVYIQGVYIPDGEAKQSTGGHDHGGSDTANQDPTLPANAEKFTRLLNISAVVGTVKK